jgi:hypothetical protein
LLRLVIDLRNQPVVVPANVEDRAISVNIRRAESLSHVVKVLPFRFTRDFIPGVQGRSDARVFFGKLPDNFIVGDQHYSPCECSHRESSFVNATRVYFNRDFFGHSYQSGALAIVPGYEGDVAPERKQQRKW